jgi:trans-2,3-dihydro-3-hydroxyanthranilate isomerase
MFTPRMTEDPATGSATAATTALLALHRNKTTLNLNVSQGVDMGRASVLFAGYDASSGKAVVRVGGKCVITLEGTFSL